MVVSFVSLISKAPSACWVQCSTEFQFSLIPDLQTLTMVEAKIGHGRTENRENYKESMEFLPVLVLEVHHYNLK